MAVRSGVARGGAMGAVAPPKILSFFSEGEKKGKGKRKKKMIP